MSKPECFVEKDVNVEWFKDAATAVVDDFERMSETNNLMHAAYLLTELSNRISDLASYLPQSCEHGWRAHEEEW